MTNINNTPPYLEHTDRQLYAVHNESLCKGRHCSLHNRSDHVLRHAPQHWRSDRGFMERICEHGCGHPDPDDYAVITQPEVYGIHGCCHMSCCQE